MAECSGGGGWRTGSGDNGVKLISQKEQKVLGSMVVDQENIITRHVSSDQNKR